MLHRIVNALQSAPWSGQCLLCRQPSRQPLLCDWCDAALPLPPHVCSGCGIEMPDANLRCGSCQQHAPPWDRLRMLADYQPPWSTLIGQLKYRHQPEVARLLASLFTRHHPLADPPEVLIPVPLHWWRQWRRGYNQAECLARGMASTYRLTVDVRHLQRRRATRSQTQLSRHARLRNLQHAFRCQSLPWRRVALVDDVVTTGTTAGMLCDLLRTAGAESVEVWAICRTQRIGNEG